MFLHRFQQGGLCFGWCPVDFVCQQYICKDRTFDENHSPLTAVVLLQDFSPGDVGWHQVGRKLDSLKIQMKDLRDRLHQQRLRQARCSCDQAVPARKQ